MINTNFKSDLSAGKAIIFLPELIDAVNRGVRLALTSCERNLSNIQNTTLIADPLSVAYAAEALKESADSLHRLAAMNYLLKGASVRPEIVVKTK